MAHLPVVKVSSKWSRTTTTRGEAFMSCVCIYPKKKQQDHMIASPGLLIGRCAAGIYIRLAPPILLHFVLVHAHRHSLYYRFSGREERFRVGKVRKIRYTCMCPRQLRNFVVSHRWNERVVSEWRSDLPTSRVTSDSCYRPSLLAFDWLRGCGCGIAT